MSKLIITAAITGAVHIPTMSDYLPLTSGPTKERLAKCGGRLDQVSDGRQYRQGDGIGARHPRRSPRDPGVEGHR